MVIFGLYYHAGQTIIGLGSFKSSDETEADPNFDVKGIENWLKLNSGKLDKVDPTIKAAWIKTIKKIFNSFSKVIGYFLFLKK